MSYYVHQVPGRIRVRIPAIRHNRYRGTEVKHLLDVVGVDTVEVNHLTGSVVANFNPDIVEARLLLAILSEKGYFDHNRAVTCDDYIKQSTVAAGAKASRLFLGWAVGKALEGSGFSLLAALI